MTEPSREELWVRRTEWPLAAVALAFIVMYSVQILARPGGEPARILWVGCWLAWSLFVADYFARLILATDRPRWFVRHLFDLLVVALPLMRPLQMLRLVVLIGALQRAVGDVIRGRILLYTLCGVTLLVYVASLAILDAERGRPGATIESFGDAVFWSITTVTTVGYGHLYPMTATGRGIAVVLMMGGIGLVGVVTASLASWIVQRVEETDIANQAATTLQIEELRDEIRTLSEQLRGSAN